MPIGWVHPVSRVVANAVNRVLGGGSGGTMRVGGNVNITMDLEGVKALNKQLQAIGVNFPKSKIRKAANKGARLPLYAIKRDTPKLSGELRKGIIRVEELKGKRKKAKKVMMKIVIDPAKIDIWNRKDKGEIHNPGEHGGKENNRYPYYPWSANYGFALNRLGKRYNGKRFIEKGIDATTSASEKEIIESLYQDMQKLLDKHS